jgi:hypothetical protein
LGSYWSGWSNCSFWFIRSGAVSMAKDDRSFLEARVTT